MKRLLSITGVLLLTIVFGCGPTEVACPPGEYDFPETEVWFVPASGPYEQHQIAGSDFHATGQWEMFPEEIHPVSESVPSAAAILIPEGYWLGVDVEGHPEQLRWLEATPEVRALLVGDPMQADAIEVIGDLKYLLLCDGGATTEHLQALALSQPGVEALTMFTPETMVDLAPLADLRHLRSVNIDAQAEYLANAHVLETLELDSLVLDSPPMSEDIALVDFLGHVDTEMLVLGSGWDLSEAQLLAILRNASIRSLTLGLGAIESLPDDIPPSQSITSLWVDLGSRQPRFPVEAFPNLRQLSVRGLLGGDVLRGIEHLSQLEALCVEGIPDGGFVDGEALFPHLTGLSNLRSVQFRAMHADDEQIINALTGLSELHTVDMSLISNMTDASVAQLLQMPSLRYLELRENYQITGDFWGELTGDVAIESFIYSGRPWFMAGLDGPRDPGGLRTAAGLSWCTSLEALALDEDTLPRAVFGALAQLPRLQTLNGILITDQQRDRWRSYAP